MYLNSETDYVVSYIRRPMQGLVSISGSVNPSNSYFVRRYAGTTPFTKRLHRVQLDVPLQGGSVVWVQIPNQGDILTDMYIDMPIDPTTVFDRIELFCGRQIIERHYMEFRTIEEQISVPSALQRAYMGGVYPIHLTFPIPLLTLKNQDVQLRLVCKQTCPPSNLFATSTSILCNYVWLTDTERAWFNSKPFDVLFTQVQMHEENTVTDGSVFTNFINPCKELYFTQFDEMQILLNGIEQVPNMSWKFYHNLIPIDFHTKVPDGPYGVYSFSLYPEKKDPSGSLNIGLIQNQQFRVQGAQLPFRIYAVTYNIIRFENGSARILFNNLQ